MADERELQEQGVGVGTGDSTESAPSTAEPVVQPTAPKVNLNDFEEYRKEQAARDRQLQAEKRERERERQQYQAMLAQREAELERVRTAEMDDYQLKDYEIQKRDQHIAYQNQRLAEYEAQIQKREALTELSQELEVPLEAVWDSENIVEATRMAREYIKQQQQQREVERQTQETQRVAERAGKIANNRVDLGSGTPVPTNEWERTYLAAKGRKDSRSLFKLALGEQQE